MQLFIQSFEKSSGDLHIFDLSNSKISQGKMYADIAASPLSNKFVQDGRFCSAKAFRFVHRARLSLLPLGGTPMGSGLKIPLMCRRCSKASETPAHVFATCPMNHGLITRRHDQVLDVVLEVASKTREIVLEKEPIVSVNGVDFKPDIICTNKKSNRISIIELTCPIEGLTNFLDKKAEKILKYQPLIQHYAAQGKIASIHPIIVGQLGAWDPANSTALAALGVEGYKATQVARMMIKTSIENSMAILNTHLLSK